MTAPAPLPMMLDALPWPAWTGDESGRVLYANQPLLQHAGTSLEALRQSGVAALLHEAERADFERCQQQARASRVPLDYPARLRGVDGTYLRVHLHLHPLPESAGPAAWLGSCRELPPAEHESTATRAHSLSNPGRDHEQQLLDSISDHGIFRLTPEGCVASWNAGTRRIKGYDASDVLGRHYRMFFTEADRERGRPEFGLRVAAQQGRFADEGWRVKRDGTRFWASVVISALRDARGELSGFVKVTRDLTERHQAELALAAQATRLQEQADLLALANETIIVRDAESVIVSWNVAACEMYGFAEHEALGHVSHDLLQTIFPESLEAMNDALIERGFWEGELRHRKRNGEEITVLSRQALQRDATGQPRAILEVNWDITDRKRAEQALRELNETLEVRVRDRTAQLQAANEELEAFAYSVAHDLRAPLRAMQGFAQAVQEDYAAQLDELGRDYLERIATGAERLDALIQDLLAYSRLGRAEVELRPVDLAAALSMVAAQLEGELQRTHATLEVEGELPRVLAQPAVLTQVLANLLGNALKFIEPGRPPHVRITAQRQGAWVRVTVHDNGIGIDEAHHERIFRVFERLHGVTDYLGTGIGLAIVKKGVERLGGRLGVESRPGQGSRFWIELQAG